MKIKRIDEIKGITIASTAPDQTKTVDAIYEATKLAVHIFDIEFPAKKAVVSRALSSGMRMVTTLMAASSVGCDLILPTADIITRLNAEGNMVNRCQHDPYHEWDLSGKRTK